MGSTSKGPVAVIGGGLGGLCAAIFLARGGRQVTLFERAGELGGRARSRSEGGGIFNQGPHALFRGGAAMRILRELGVAPKGGVPAAGGAIVYQGVAESLVSLSTFSSAARTLLSLPLLDTRALDGITLEEWLSKHMRSEKQRAVVSALLRVSSYANGPRLQSAGAALAQLRLAARHNVLYLEGGWQQLVDSLGQLARQAGVNVVTSARLEALEHGHCVEGLRLAGGERRSFDAAVIAGGPSLVCSLVTGKEGEALRQVCAGTVPVKAATLDLALDGLPAPRRLFALGADQPLYFSCHSAWAALGEATVLHVAKYLPSAEPQDAAADQRELEALVDLVQPGWRSRVKSQRYLPSLVVTHDVVRASYGGLQGRPSPRVEGIEGLFLAGDWIGSEGMLLDASLASARAAALEILGVEAGLAGRAA